MTVKQAQTAAPAGVSGRAGPPRFPQQIGPGTPAAAAGRRLAPGRLREPALQLAEHRRYE